MHESGRIRTLWELVEHRAAASADAVKFYEPDGRTVTFGEAREQALRAAAGFRELGAGSRTRLAWQLPIRVSTPSPRARRPGWGPCIEELVHGRPAVAEAAVIGLPDRERGERVCAVVTLAGPAGPLLAPTELTDHLRRAGLMTQKLPEQLEIAMALPRGGPLGKVLKSELRVRYARERADD